MRMKGLIGLLAAAVAAVVVAVIVSSGGGAPTGDPLAGNAVLPGLGKRLGEVLRVTMVHGETKTTLLRQGRDWVVEEKSDFPADPGKTRQTLLGLAELRYVEQKTRKPEFYPRLDLEDAGKAGSKSTLVTLSDEKGGLLGEVIIGKRRIDELGGGNDGIYVRKPGDPQSWLARGTLDLSGDMASWLDRKVIDIEPETVKQAVLTQPDGSTLTIARKAAGDPPELVGAPADAKLKNDTALQEPASALAGLDLADVRPAADMTFPGEGVGHAAYTTFDGLTIKATLLDKDGVTWARFQASGDGDAAPPAAELNARLSRWVYAIVPYKAKALRTKLSDLVEAAKAS